MSKTVHYTEKPLPVQYEAFGEFNHFTVAINIHEEVEEVAVADSTSESSESSDTTKNTSRWIATVNDFWERASALSPEEVEANPEAFIDRANQLSDQRTDKKTLIQQLVDDLRSGCPIVPVPSFREDAAVCHRPADDVKMLGGVMMGGLPYFELASGEIVSLTVEDLQNIMKDVTQWEIDLQQKKQACWSLLDAANTQEELDAAVEKARAEIK